MPPRGRGRRGKGPSPRSRKTTPKTEIPITTVEEDAVPEPETPSNTVGEDAVPEPEAPSNAVGEDAVPESETPSNAAEESLLPKPDLPSAAAVTGESSTDPNAVANDAVEEKQIPEPELPPVAAAEENLPNSIAVASDVSEEKQVPEPEVPAATVEMSKDEALPPDTVEEVIAVEKDEVIAVEKDGLASSTIGEMEVSTVEETVVSTVEETVVSTVVETVVSTVEETEVSTVEETEALEENVPEEELMDSGNLASELVEMERADEIVDREEGIVDEDVQGNEQDVDEEENEAKNIEGSGDEAGDDEGIDNMEEDDKSETDDEDDEEEDHSIYMHAPLSDKKKQKDFEIFIGGLDREAVEEDLIKVFGEFGEIQSARIVKHPTTQKSKGFAFIRYATVEQAKKVLAELKDGIEVRGKRVGLSASQDNDTLYLGNVCKTWTKDDLTAALKGYGIEQIDGILLPEDAKNEGMIKGYAFVEFSTHSDAMAAFQRLRKPDAVFGCDRSAKVAFAPSSMHPSEEILSQVKTVYVEGLPESWDEEKVMELCKQYGEIEKIQLSRNFTMARRRDFGFIAFTSREGAVACVEGINNAQLGEGETNVRANIAKPQNKGRLAKQGARGGFRVKKAGEKAEASGSNKKGNGKFKGASGKGKVQSNAKSGRGGKAFRPQGQVSGGQGRPSFQYHQKKEQAFRGGKRSSNNRFVDNARPSKRPRDNYNYSNMRGRPSGNRNNPQFGRSKKNFNKHQAAYRNPYPPAHGAPTTSYQGGVYGAVSGSKRPYPHMEPHAGYAHPAPNQVQGPYGYGQGSAGGYNMQGTNVAGYAGGMQGTSVAGYAGGSVPPASQVPNYPSYTGYEAGYGYPNNAAAYPPQGPYY